MKYSAIPVLCHEDADRLVFAVPSQTAKPPTCYLVEFDAATGEVRCTCPDWEIRRVETEYACKHGGLVIGGNAESRALCLAKLRGPRMRVAR